MAARACYWSQGGQTKEVDTDVHRAARREFGYLYFCICQTKGYMQSYKDVKEYNDRVA